MTKPKKPQKPQNVKLAQKYTPAELERLDKLVERKGINRTAVIKLAQAEMATREGI